jgi:polar amino acid transport system substrate-binding protein
VRRLLGVLVVSGLGAVTAASATDVLRICADPDNLPFSAATGSVRGLYIEIAELVAARLGLTADYTWWHTYYGQRAVRNTLLADRCDVFFGLPEDKEFMGRQLDRSAHFLGIGYAVVVPRGFAFATLDDLKGVTVAVQFRSPPQFMLAERNGFRMVTFRQVEEAMDALAHGEAGAAFVWGPTAGYYNKTRLGGAWRVVPVAGPGLQWQVAVAVRKGNTLKERLDRVLVELAPEIQRLADQYGFPLVAPVDLEPKPELQPVTPRASSPESSVNPFNGRADVVPVGRSIFNQHCAHCHAPNAQSPEPSRDLRRLKRRYGDQRAQVFYATVTGGRPTKGMPPWAQALSADQIWQVWTFLESVQVEP